MLARAARFNRAIIKQSPSPSKTNGIVHVRAAAFAKFNFTDFEREKRWKT